MAGQAGHDQGRQWPRIHERNAEKMGLEAGQRATEIGVERRELGIQAGQCAEHHLPDRAQRMPRRDALFKVK